MLPYAYYSELFKGNEMPSKWLTKPKTAITAPFNPELKGMSQSPYGAFMGGLQKPVRTPYQNLFQQRYNLFRGATQSATRTAEEQMKELMSGRGFRGGESGYADTALGQIARTGQEQLSRGAGEIELSEAQRREGWEQEQQRLNLQRMLGGGQLALQGEEGAMDRLLQYLNLLSGAEQYRWSPYWGSVGSIYGGSSQPGG